MQQFQSRSLEPREWNKFMVRQSSGEKIFSPEACSDWERHLGAADAGPVGDMSFFNIYLITPNPHPHPSMLRNSGGSSQPEASPGTFSILSALSSLSTPFLFPWGLLPPFHPSSPILQIRCIFCPRQSAFYIFIKWRHLFPPHMCSGSGDNDLFLGDAI